MKEIEERDIILVLQTGLVISVLALEPVIGITIILILNIYLPHTNIITGSLHAVHPKGKRTCNNIGTSL